MLYIHQYFGANEDYIILTEDPEFDKEENARPGFKCERSFVFEGEDASALPLDRVMMQA